MLSSFPPAVASTCPMWDRFHVTGEASVVVASTRNQKESHLFMQVWRDSGGGRGRDRKEKGDEKKICTSRIRSSKMG